MGEDVADPAFYILDSGCSQSEYLQAIGQEEHWVPHSLSFAHVRTPRSAHPTPRAR